MRRFALVAAYAGRADLLPQRATAASAGYDLCAAEGATVPPGGVVLVSTGVKAYMPPGEVLLLHVRSSLGVKRGLLLANGTGVVDSDYVDNPENEGHILVALYNRTATAVTLAAGERIAQGIFMAYQRTDDDVPRSGARTGGFGSTGH